MAKAVVAVESNPELKQVFVILLKIGNYLNQGSNKGNQVSFNPDLLKSLKNTKAVGNHSKSTMLDFLLMSVLRKSPEVTQFALKLENCKAALKLETDVISDQLKDF